MSAATEAPATTTEPRTNPIKAVLTSDRPYMVFLALIVLVVFFSVMSPVFLSTANFANIGRQTTLVTIVAVGMTFVIIAAEIDLSVASTLKLAGVCAALFMQDFGDNWVTGALVGLLVGIIIGLVNGLLTTRLGIPSFLVTLGIGCTTPADRWQQL